LAHTGLCFARFLVKKAAKAAEKAAKSEAKAANAPKPKAEGAAPKAKKEKAKEPEEEPFVNTTPKGDKKGSSSRLPSFLPFNLSPSYPSSPQHRC
jgi:hypothetical protein